MQLHQLKPNLKKKLRKRVGRGGKKGTYSGKGMKGQMSRAGRKPRADFAGGDTPMSKRIPKKRGQSGKLKKIRRGVRTARLMAKPIILDLKNIESKFKKGEIVSPKTLFNKGLISKIRRSIPNIKILGESKKELEFKGVSLSKKLQDKIEPKKKEKAVKPKPEVESKKVKPKKAKK